MALTNKDKAKVARNIGSLLGALAKGVGKRKKKSSGSNDMAGIPAQPKKGCGACG